MSAQEQNGREDQPRSEGMTQERQTLGETSPADADAFAEASIDLTGALQARLAELESQNRELQEQVLRALAEVENVRRRSQDEVAKARKFGIEAFAESLVPVKDSLEAALAQADQSVDSWREGVEITLRQLSQAFERHRLMEIAPAVGDKFDPHQHQAVSSAPSDQPANTIVQLLQKGYLIADRVLRPALVIVAA